MVFPYLVKHDGVYYPAGTDVPIEETKSGGGNKTPTVVVSGKVDEKKVEKKDEFFKAEPAKTRKYTEEDLKLPYMKLKALAKKEGFKVENTTKAPELKDMLRSV